jgi:hypothetical protein
MLNHRHRIFSLQNVLNLVREENFTVVLAMRMSQKKFHFSQNSVPVLVYFHLVLDLKSQYDTA